MGCISSRHEIKDSPNVFQVMNVDEQGNRVNTGELEITDVNLVLHQRGKRPIQWPLKALRRYGFDADHFSFESGRRSQTGPGIYAFECKRAEQLFNLLQSRIQIRNDGELEPTIPAGPSVYLEPGIRRMGGRSLSHNGITTRLSSVGSASGSTGPLSPQSTNSPLLPGDTIPIIPPLPVNRPVSQNLYANEEIIASASMDPDETNNNKISEAVVEPTYSNSSVLLEGVTKEGEPTYKLLEDLPSPTLDNSHLYMNIVPGTDDVISGYTVPSPPVLPVATFDWEDDTIHNYANLTGDEVENHRRLPPLRLPTTPTSGVARLNYIVLDLEYNQDAPRSPTNSLPPDSPKKTAEGYATIDFKKTVALSHSVNPQYDDSMGTRKTRHNSNISDILTSTRQSSFISE